MSSRIIWRNPQTEPTCTTGLHNLPRKPVIWWGSAYVIRPDGEKDTISWHSKKPMTTAQAKETIKLVVAEMLAESDQQLAIDAGFDINCR